MIQQHVMILQRQEKQVIILRYQMVLKYKIMIHRLLKV